MPDLTAEELIAAYNEGRRDFTRVRLDGVDLSNVVLSDAVFDSASFASADLHGCVLRNVA